MKLKLLLFLFTLTLSSTLVAQETVGLLQHEVGSYDGYTLFTPEKSDFVYLINNCGQVINTWEFTDKPALTCYLLDNGNLLRAGKPNLEIRDWDNNLVWQYNLRPLGLRQHHDIEPLPNGNILCLVKDVVTEAEQISLGKNPALLNGDLKSEKLVEIEPVGTNDMNIVWEWRFLDHIIQDFDINAPNYGDVAAHPELMDFNYSDYNMNHSDWLHMNSVAYNADLQHIVLSAKSTGEIYVIDHSTTTAEAAGHSGGNSGKGGDFIWRWGNPEAYRQGTPADRKLFEQHDAKWITNGYVNEGKISVFNNDQGGDQTHSSIHIVSPQLDVNNNYEMENGAFLPTDYYWSWSGEVQGDTVIGLKKCGVQALPNGNMILCETSKGRLTEVNLDGDIVWVYRNPAGSEIHNQYSTNLEILGDNSIFRGEKYPKDHIAFTGRNLTPGDIIEDINANSEECITNLSTPALETQLTIGINNPVSNKRLQFHSTLENTNLIIYDLRGKVISKLNNFNGNNLKVSQLNAGLYFLKIEKEGKQQVLKVVIE
ncbi:aryl-sulfate sulfotransferase [Xanthomarina sp. F1114]|uniref:arylsulfotransferase family protein n=1 Tax=Xanthomarina sp. F1114 TaxID=2996019 RepID=UPI00225E2D88|nr:aryl-sulfate sulfotransferase [Xanthomarina sp. F1114]MCX7547653.1 aryl-sulfate sulfotransferase [Xanthomarina sp. F1114]